MPSLAESNSLRHYLQAATADNTRKAYRSAIRQFEKIAGHKKEIPDVTLILTGFFGAFRRSELVGLQASDLRWEPDGLLIRLPRSKTDQQGVGLLRALPYGKAACCPAKAMKVWLDAADITSGPVFRPTNRWDQIQEKVLAPGAINALLKTLGQACQFDFVPELSSHSFRRGLSTSTARKRVDFELIKKQGGCHRLGVHRGRPAAQQQCSLILMEKMATLMDAE